MISRYEYKGTVYYINVDNISFIGTYSDIKDNGDAVYIVNIVFNFAENIIHFEFDTKVDADSCANKIAYRR